MTRRRQADKDLQPTSYPTAVQFGAGVDARTYQYWLAALPAAAPVSIYLHVPFCAELCLYCGCHTTVARRYCAGIMTGE